MKPPLEIFNSIDLLIHPSLKKEPFGRILLEAMASQIPIITTGLGGAGELVKDQYNGLHFIIHDYKGLFNKVDALVSSQELRKRLLKNSQRKLGDLLIQTNDQWESLMRECTLDDQQI